MKKLLLVSLFALSTTFSLNALADTITYVGSGTGPGSVAVSASAMFDISGNTLTITLKNTSPSNNGQDVPGSTLTGVFWDLTGDPTLTPVSATLASGSSIIGDTCSPTSCVGVTNLGGEFGYQASNFSSLNADRGISSSGYLSTGLPGNVGNFGGVNLDDPASLDGINFGIVSKATGYNPNGGLDTVPVVQDSVVFVLTGVSGLTSRDISHVSFQYGTDFSELNIPGTTENPGGPGNSNVPEPATVAMLGLGLLGLATARKAKRK